MSDQVTKFMVHPNTGIQIFRGFPTPQWLKEDIDAILDAAKKMAGRNSDNETIMLLEDNAACRAESSMECTGWIPCELPEPVFFRLRHVGQELLLDLIIDTQQGAGKQEGNRVEVAVPRPLVNRLGALRKGLLEGLREHKRFRESHYHLADFYVSKEPVNVDGTLTIDFGNSSTAFVFRKLAQGPAEIEPLELNNPWDPLYYKRSPDQLKLMRSNLLLLRVGEENEKPWFILGDRADEIVQERPLATYVYSPKKYVREWPDEKRFRQPRRYFRDVTGRQHAQHYRMLRFVRDAIEQMLQMTLSSLCNPKCETFAPVMYPQISRIAVTYPLTWRECDRLLFKRTVHDIALELFDLEPEVKENFKVELVCSEPVAVAAFVLWETFYQFVDNLQLAAASLGNIRGTQNLNLLVVDVGGGSTDVACVEVGWLAREATQKVDVSFRLVESMRFNRAGDRLSHFLAVAIREFLFEKYGLAPSLAFEGGDDEPHFTPSYRRQAISRIFDLTERAKSALASDPTGGGVWELEKASEVQLLQTYEPIRKLDPNSKSGRGSLSVTHAILEQWVRMDVQSKRTNHEPGFMDIFIYLTELAVNLHALNRTPDLVVLSGRTTRLPFMAQMIAEHVGLPAHRVRTLDKIMPTDLTGQQERNLDKLAVVCGAQYFRSGDQIRFISLPNERIFNRFIGTVKTTPDGLKLLQTLIKPGESAPQTIKVCVPGRDDVRIGHAFRRNGNVQIMANLSNAAPDDVDVDLEVVDDHTIRPTAAMAEGPVEFYEWVPGGDDVLTDNFNDTGKIDEEPRRPSSREQGVLTSIVRSNIEQWYHD